MKISLYTYWFTWTQRPHHFVDVASQLGHSTTIYSNRSIANLFTGSSNASHGQVIRTNYLLPSPRLDRIPGALMLNSFQRRRLLKSFQDSHSDVHVFASVPSELLERKPPYLIYDCMDDWSDFPSLPPSVVENERRLCQMADKIWVVSEHLYRKFDDDYAAKLEYVPNGVDFRHFSEATEFNEPHMRPTLGYVGALHSWFDAQLVATVAAMLPNWDIILVGPILLEPNQRQSLQLPNIQFLGRQPYDALPKIIAGFDVSMIPFILTDLIKGTSPIKLYEYLAAGLPVVSTSMPEVLPFREPGVVICADNPDEFAQGIQDLYHAKSPEMLARRQQIARHHTWQERFQQALRGIGQP